MRHALIVFIALSALAGAAPARAEQAPRFLLAEVKPDATKPNPDKSDAPRADSIKAASNQPARLLIYKPPLRGAPASRLGGGTRSGGKADAIHVLAPDHTGLTTRAQPTLYWYASGSSVGSVEVVLIAADAEKPLLVKNVPVSGEGLYALDLAKTGVSLAPDTDYEWFVSVVRDAEQRSKDLSSGGTIRRIAPVATAAAPDDRQAPVKLAEAGLWYDSLDSVSLLIARTPADAGLRALRADLLDQVGLATAADYARTTP